MTSERQASANRRNAQKSTGPRSAIGKARASRNSLRHGLGIALAADPAFAGEIPGLACAIAGPRKDDPLVLAHAKRVAAAELELRRVRQARALILDRIETMEGVDITNESCRAVFARFVRQLAVMDRYERRATSRRKSAIRILDQAVAIHDTTKATGCRPDPGTRSLRPAGVGWA